jgi:hypothetical protein
MANGDDLDPYPTGMPYTMGGLSSDDPLIDWASTMKPSQFAQYVHDPEGFKQNMINSGQAPPEHNYVQGPGGQLQAVDLNNNPIRTDAQGRIQGNVSDYLNPPPQTAAQAVAPPAAPGRSRALGYVDPGGGFGQSPEQENLPEAGKGTPPSPGAVGRAFIPAPITPQRPPPELPPLRNPSPVPEGTTPMPRPSPLRPTDIPQAGAERPDTGVTEGAPGNKPAAEKAKEKKDVVEPYSSEAVSDFAKSLQGVKMPTRPAWQPMGAPGVRGAVGIQPQIQTLLSAIGQGRPTPQQLSLMRLLGRA